jgi:hypothetical protein
VSLIMRKELGVNNREMVEKGFFFPCRGFDRFISTRVTLSPASFQPNDSLSTPSGVRLTRIKSYQGATRCIRPFLSPLDPSFRPWQECDGIDSSAEALCGLGYSSGGRSIKVSESLSLRVNLPTTLADSGPRADVASWIHPRALTPRKSSSPRGVFPYFYDRQYTHPKITRYRIPISMVTNTTFF